MDFDPEMIKLLPVWFVAFLLSTTFHEASHAFVGHRGGDSTAEDQVTLDPTPHIRREPVGMILVPLLSFFFYGGHWMIGWASAPYDPHWAQRFPKRAALMAAAGPLSNFLLTFLAGVGMMLAIRFGTWSPPLGGIGLDRLVVARGGEDTAFTAFVSVMFSLNLLLGIFNLIPLPPLDGHGVVPIFLNDRQREKWQRLFHGPGQYLGLVVAMVVLAKIYQPIFLSLVRLIYGF